MPEGPLLLRADDCIYSAAFVQLEGAHPMHRPITVKSHTHSAALITIDPRRWPGWWPRGARVARNEARPRPAGWAVPANTVMDPTAAIRLARLAGLAPWLAPWLARQRPGRHPEQVAGAIVGADSASSALPKCGYHARRCWEFFH